MNLKDKMIRKLLDIGKKHRILIYPTLALVAVISAVSHAVYWGRGNGKKLVASVLIMVLLVSQSFFLTSSADVSDNGAGSAPSGVSYATGSDAIQSESINGTDGLILPYSDGIGEGEDGSQPLYDGIMTVAEAPNKITVNIYRVDENGNTTTYPVMTREATAVEPAAVPPTSYTFTEPTDTELAQHCFSCEEKYFTFTDLYFDQACSSEKLTTGTCTVTSDHVVGSACNVYFKATRKSYPIKLSCGYEESAEAPVTIEKEVAGAATGDINPTLQYTINKGDFTSDNILYRYGYTLSGFSCQGVQYEDGGLITVSPTDMDVQRGYTVDLICLWKAMDFDVTFDAVGGADNEKLNIEKVDGTGEWTQSYTYDSEVVLPTNDDIAAHAHKEGYYVSGWKDEDGGVYNCDGTTTFSTNLAKKEGDKKSAPNIKGKKLTAVWKYKDLELEANVTNAQFTGDGATTYTITGTYGDTINCLINARYNFDQTQGTHFSYSISPEDISKLGGYGLGVLANSEGDVNTSYQISGQLKKVTKTETVEVTLTVTDDNQPAENKTHTYKIKIVVNPRPVHIDPATVRNHLDESRTPHKTYDGNVNVDVKTTASVLSDELALSDTTGESGDVYVTFDESAVFASADAGTGKDVILSNVALAGPKAENYVLADVTPDQKITAVGIGEIEQQSVHVTMQLRDGQQNTVKYGEDTPKYTLRISDPEHLSAADKAVYDGCLTDDDYDGFMQTYLGFTGYTTGRKLYSPTGAYDVYPSFDSTEKNYVDIESASDSLTVTIDAGILDVNYTLSEQKENGYYQGLTISPTGDYDKIRLISATNVTETGEEIGVSMDRSYVQGTLFSKVQLSDFPDMTGGTIVFQLMNTSTGAVSDKVTLSDINIDTTPPVLRNVKVSPGVPYINEFGFGSYFHSQVINGGLVEWITIEFEYDAEDSDAECLFYHFTDQNGDTVGDTNRRLELKKAGDGSYHATVTVGTSDYGELVVYAKDTTGNESVKSRIKLDVFEDWEEGQGYYEWMVENTIHSFPIQVYDLQDKIASTAGVWYNGLKPTVLATDAESGVNRIEWHITTPSGREIVYTDSVLEVFKDAKQTEYTFKRILSDAGLEVGEYYISAVFYDNAGNSVKLDQAGPYLLDCIKPQIRDITEASTDTYLSNVFFQFTVTEGANESGVATVSLYKRQGEALVLLQSWGAQDEYSYHITDNGQYVVRATDVAGNVQEYERTFSHISEVVPQEPVITIQNEIKGNGVWDVETRPSVRITSVTSTSDHVPVATYYSVSVNGQETRDYFNTEEFEFPLTEDGIYLISAWSVSASGVSSTVATKSVYVDTVAPTIEITESAVNTAGGNVTINFKITDQTSGVNAEKVTLDGKTIAVNKDGNNVTGSFVADKDKVYKITAEDEAGNLSEVFEFVPLRLKVSPVTDINPTNAQLEVDIIEGTYPVSDYYVAYKKSTDSQYVRCMVSDEGNDLLDITALFRDLEPDTRYDYRVYAVTQTSREIKTYEGSFRTGGVAGTGSIYGKVQYAAELGDTLRTYPIYVNLYQGNACVAGIRLDENTGMGYRFSDVPDGTYQVVATNGFLTKTSSVTITNGGITYPADYIQNDGINFILSGISTGLEIEDDELCLTVDDLDSIFETELYVNVTKEELDAVNYDGATIEIVLHARYVDASNVGSGIDGIFQSRIGSNAEIMRYIEMSVTKEFTDKNGNTTTTTLPELVEPVTITFPLGSLAGQKIYVAAMHGDLSSYQFHNWNGSNIIVSKDYVTIQTRYFSIYALYRYAEAHKTYTVRWIDGDGNVMKTETVEEGKAATPPEKTPTKKATSQYTYTFAGWDTDYSIITSDTNIMAYFTASRIGNPGNGSDPGQNGGNKNGVSTTPNRYTYLGSSNSPKTGDVSPIAAVLLTMFFAAGGMLFLGKKIKK